MSNVIVVLGMHRSGTSAVTGVMSMLGASIPKALMPANECNERGYFESLELMTFHDEILKSAGTKWDDWRPFNKNWFTSPPASKFKKKAKKLFAKEFNGAPLAVLKDPRVCRFFPFWAEVFREMDATTHIVIPIRSPLDVARSLKKRDGISLNKGMLMWLRHCLDAEVNTRTDARSLMLWTEFRQDWRGSCDKIAAEINLSWPKFSDRSSYEIEKFLSDALVHHETNPHELTIHREVNEWAARAFEALFELNRNPMSNSAMATLDHIRDQLDRSSEIFGRLLIDYEVSLEELRDQTQKLNAQCDELRLKDEEARNELTKAVEDNGVSERQFREALEAAMTAKEANDRRLDQLLAELDAARGEIGRFECQIKNLHSEHALEIAESRGRAETLQSAVDEAAKNEIEQSQLLSATLSELAALREEQERLRADLQAAEWKLAEALAGMSAHEGRADLAEAVAAEIDRVKEELLRRLAALEAELAEAQGNERLLGQSADALREQLAANAAAIEETTARLARSEQDKEETRRELAAASIDLERIQAERDRQRVQLDGALRKVELLTQDVASANSARILAQRAAHDLAQEARQLDLERQNLLGRISTVEEERRVLELSRDKLSLEAARQREHFESSAVHHFDQISDLATKLGMAHARARELEAKQEEIAARHGESLREAQRERQGFETALESERAERARLAAAHGDLASRLESLEAEKRALAEASEHAAAEAARRQRNFENDSVNHFTEVTRLSSDLNMARAELGRVKQGQAAEIVTLRARLVDAEAGAARAAARDRTPAFVAVAEPFRRLWRAWALKRSGLFDPVFYRAHYPECEASGLSPFKHYLTLGFARGYKPNQFFDSHWYLEKNEDVRLSGANPLIHYWRHGWKEARDPGPDFSTEKYLDSYPDVRASGKNPLAHYLLHGIREERAPQGLEA